jgi:hypothetical protein
MMSRTVIEVIDSIRAKSRERDYLLASLELWAQAEAQGIDSSAGELLVLIHDCLAQRNELNTNEVSLQNGITLVQSGC